jgi:hypothetical protein
MKELIVGLNIKYNYNRNQSAEQALPTYGNQEGREAVNAITVHLGMKYTKYTPIL